MLTKKMIGAVMKKTMGMQSQSTGQKQKFGEPAKKVSMLSLLTLELFWEAVFGLQVQEKCFHKFTKGFHFILKG